MATVTVACKLPNGLILRGFQMVKKLEPVMGGGSREVLQAQDTGERFVVRGNARRAGEVPLDENGDPVRYVSGAALTVGVPADIWNTWYEQNKNSDMVRKGMIFAHARTLELTAQARDFKDQRSGMEPMLSPQDDPRMKSKKQDHKGSSISAITPDNGANA